MVDHRTWRAELDELCQREKAATRELDATADQRRQLPMVELPDYTLVGADGPIRLADVFDGQSQLITYHRMWSDGAEWQCGGCTGFTSQSTRLEFLQNYDARFAIVTNGPIDEELAYRRKVGTPRSPRGWPRYCPTCPGSAARRAFALQARAVVQRLAVAADRRVDQDGAEQDEITELGVNHVAVDADYAKAGCHRHRFVRHHPDADRVVVHLHREGG
ncbi:DUF899 domain-containing protein [Mycobacterium tilburgii]|uniref:DUF899 domain-containing protein n=1 Tax=Mycobacterium tilburgii TaxID=44467 RepID=UPI0021B2076A|nr:DUF899 domain-containing protein [Mycobacterium tilburgii]